LSIELPVELSEIFFIVQEVFLVENPTQESLLVLFDTVSSLQVGWALFIYEPHFTSHLLPLSFILLRDLKETLVVLQPSFLFGLLL